MRFYNNRAYRIFLAGVVVWCGFIILGPLLASLHQPAASVCYKFFSPICHQDPARSFFIFGRQFCVCIRCTAIYFGFLASVLVAPLTLGRLRIQARVLWCCATVPMLVDVVLDTAGVHASDTTLRIVTGAIFGIIGAHILTPLIIDAFSELFSSSSEYRITHEPET
jgi:uncharacterized membrane protein